MSLLIPIVQKPVGTPRNAKRRILLPIAVILLASLLGTAGRYCFLDRKPKIAMTVGLGVNGNTATRGLRSAGPDGLLLVGDGDVQLVDLVSRKKQWTVEIPKPPPADAVRQAAVNARFAGLQAWADDLSRKRAHLANESEIKAFNSEAAEYHTELNAARADVLKSQNPTSSAPAVQAPARPAPAMASAARPVHALGSDRPAMDALRPVVDPDVQILEDRIEKRREKLQAWKAALDVKRAKAKTPFQLNAVAEEGGRYAAALAMQKKDEDESWTLSFSKSADVGELAALAEKEDAPAPGSSVAIAQREATSSSSDDDIGSKKTMAAICGDRLWIIQGAHAVALDRASGAVEADVVLAGPVQRVFSDAKAAIVIASVGTAAVQVTKLNADAPPRAFCYLKARCENAFAMSDGSVTPNIQNERTEFLLASPLWEWHQTRRLQAVEVHGKMVALLFGDELKVIRSICW